MPEFVVGDTVKVEMPRGYNKRGVLGISVMYTTSPEAKFEGATGRVIQVNPRGPYTVHQYLVDFRDHDNSRIGIPWQSQWFREEWLSLVERRPAEAGVAEAGRDATGHGVATHQANQPPNAATRPEHSVADDRIDASPATDELPVSPHGVNGETASLDELVSYAWSDDFDDPSMNESGSGGGAPAESSTRRRLRPRDASVAPGPPPTIGELGRSAASTTRRQEAGKRDGDANR